MNTDLLPSCIGCSDQNGTKTDNDQLIMVISHWLINLESEIQSYFWESTQPYYSKWSSRFGDNNHSQEAGSSCNSYEWMLPQCKL